MKKLIMMVIGLFMGIFLIPALFAFAIGVGGTILGFMAEPRVMLVLIIILAVISIPGMIVMFIAKR